MSKILRSLAAAGLMAGALAASGAAAAASGELWYAAQTLEVNAKPGADYLGTLDVASPVKILEKKNGFARIRVEGWSLKEYPSQIFEQAGLRIEYASFDEEGVVKLSAKQEKTVQGNVWQASSAEGWVPADALTKDLNALWKAGAERHADACSSCHGAPAAKHFTANQWAATLPVRGGRTGHTRRGANALMFKYLQAHAKPM